MRKNSLRYARLSAAVAGMGVLLGAAHMAHAQTLTWDASGQVPPTDGAGNWDTSSPLWYNGATATTWTNGDSAVFGNPSNTTVIGAPPLYAVSLNANITAQNIVLGESADNGVYSIYDQGTPGGQTLTLAGNLVKATAEGELVVQLSNAMLLTAGNHVVSINDTGGPEPELSMDNSMVETGGSATLTINNAAYNSNYTSYGTFVLNAANTYSGGTNIIDGILTDDAAGALGSGTVTIGTLGALAYGGNSTTAPQSLTISNPILIQRSDYTDPNFSDNPGAIISGNSGNSANAVTFTGPFVIDSNDAQLQANTSTIVVDSNITYGPDVQGGVLTLTGDTAGYVNLLGNNTALTGGIVVTGNVELGVDNYNNLGGPTASLTMAGGVLHPIAGAFTSFGTLNVNYSTFNGGIDVDPGETFTITQNVGGASDSGGSLSERGAGTLTLSGTDILPGTSFWDGWSASAQGGGTLGGNIDVTGTVSMGSLRLRSPTVNITGTLTLTGNTYNSFGEDSTGTFGGPDEAVINVTGNGVLDETSGDDFNLSDNANTHGTLNVSGNGSVVTNGNVWVGKSPGAVGIISLSGNATFTADSDNTMVGSGGGTGTVSVGGSATFTTTQITWFGEGNNGIGSLVQSGGVVNIDRSGNFGFILGDGRGGNDNGAGFPTGTYSLSAGTFNDENGEIYVGEGSNGSGYGVGTWTQTGGAVNIGDWFVVGREGGAGTVTISGNSTFTKDTSDGGANVAVGQGSSIPDTFTIEGNAVANIESGQLVVGDNSATATMTIEGNAAVNLTTTASQNQVWIGNNTGDGVVNVGSLSDPVGSAPSLNVDNWFAIGRNGSGTGTLNVYDGSVTINNTADSNTNYFDISGDGGNPTGIVNVYGGTLTASQTLVGENGGGQAIVNVHGGTVNLGSVILANANTVTGTINLDGGLLLGTGFTAQNGVLGEGNGSGVGEMFFNGGTLSAPSGTINNNFVGAKVTSVVSTSGAIINANGGDLNINSALTHDSTLGGADGGLTIVGTGTVQLGTPGSHSPLNTYTGATKVQGGLLIASTAGSLPGNTPAAISSTGTLQLGAGTGLSTLSSLSITGSGVFDITDNHVLINYGSSDPVSSILSYLRTGYNGGTWNGPGIISSSARTQTNGFTYGVGWADGDDNTHNVSTSLVSSGQILLKYTLLGDANLDGTVNGSDFSILAANFGLGVTNWDQGNFLYGSSVNGSDFSALAANFGQGDSGADQSITTADIQALDAFAVANDLPVPNVSVVPEPASLGLLALGGIVALRRRRKA